MEQLHCVCMCVYGPVSQTTRGHCVFNNATQKITIDAKQGALSLTGLQWNIVDSAQGSAAGSSEQSVHSAEEEEDEEEATADQKSPVLVFN